MTILSGREELKAGECFPTVFRCTRSAGEKEDIGNDGDR
jgi:hypothetical protein